MVIIAIIIFWYEISRLKKQHSEEIAKLEKSETELKNRMREREDELFLIYQKEKAEIVQNELKFFFKCDDYIAKNYYEVLKETYMIRDFFAAQTDDKRMSIIDNALIQYDEICKDA